MLLILLECQIIGAITAYINQFYFGVGHLWLSLSPDKSSKLGGVVNKILKCRSSMVSSLLLPLVAVSEELNVKL